MKLPLEFTGNYWLFMLRFWVRKSGDSGGNLDPNDQSLSGRSVTTTHDLNRHIVFEFIQKKKKSTNLSDSRCRESNIGLARVNETTAGLGYARPHTNAATSAAIANIRFEFIPHPPYRPDLAPSDFRLFSGLKEHLIISK